MFKCMYSLTIVKTLYIDDKICQLYNKGCDEPEHQRLLARLEAVDGAWEPRVDRDQRHDLRRGRGELHRHPLPHHLLRRAVHLLRRALYPHRSKVEDIRASNEGSQ